MNLLFYLVIHTANVLGSFNDPFEFEGDYGTEVNPIRQKVFEFVVSKEALSKNLNDSQIQQIMEKNNVNEIEIKNYRKILLAQAIEEDRAHGPFLYELVTPELINDLTEKQQELQHVGFNKNDLEDIIIFIKQYADKKVFHFLRNNPSELLSLDKALRDKASREGKTFNLPILSSTQTLHGRNSEELKKDLLQMLFNAENLSITKPKELLVKSLNQLDKDFLKQFFGENSTNQDLQVFCTPAGQIFFYWLYQALNLQLISEDQNMIEQINKVKKIFAHTIGDPQVRADIFREKLIAADSGVVFTQESDSYVPQALLKDGLFLPVNKQNPQDGTFIFLRSDLWESDYEIISIEDYEGFKAGKMNVILAKRKGTGQQFLLASCHGHSTKPEDGRLQISLIMEKFHQLSDGNLQLLIGIDANTKSEEDVKLFREHLDALGLASTQVGPTTVKKRMVTAQHSKAGRFAIDEEDYLITLKPENGGHLQFHHVTVGFKEENVDINKPLPNIDNQSDHYPVGASMTSF